MIQKIYVIFGALSLMVVGLAYAAAPPASVVQVQEPLPITGPADRPGHGNPHIMPSITFSKDVFEGHLKDVDNAIENLFTAKPYEKAVLQYGYVKFPFKDFTEYQRNMYYLGNAENVTQGLRGLANSWGQLYSNIDNLRTKDSITKEDLKAYIVSLKEKRMVFAAKFEAHVASITATEEADKEFLHGYLESIKEFHSTENLHKQEE